MKPREYSIHLHDANRQIGITDLGFIMLHRGRESWPLERSLGQLLPYRGFEAICLLDEASSANDISYFSRTYPWITFIVVDDSMTVPHRIQVAVTELHATYFLLFWGDMELITQPDPRILRWIRAHSAVCATPVLYHPDDVLVPTLAAPVMDQYRIGTLSFFPNEDGEATLYPHDFTGIYNRSSFLKVGGVMPGFSSSYWALLDYGVRVWMREERILSCTGFVCRYAEESLPLDTSENRDAMLFMQRNGSFSVESGQVRFSRKQTRKFQITSPAEQRRIQELHSRARRDLYSLISEWKPPQGRVE